MSDQSHHDHGHDHGHDDWFRHGSDEGPPQHEHAAHVNSHAIGLTLLAIVFGVLLTVILLSMYYISYTTNLKAQRQEGVESAGAYLVYRDDAARRLERSGWVDREAGTVNIPIERAMDQVVSFYNAPGRQGMTDWVPPRHRATPPSIAHADGIPHD